MAKDDGSRVVGIADPSNLRDHLDAIDSAIFELVATRTRLMNEVQDAFTVLRTSAQIFREIFFGVRLPIDSPKTLIERAGGPDRLIEVSYKETGNKLFALADVITAIPKFKECFPITSFEKLALKLEEIKEDGPDTGPTWFVERITNRRLQGAIEREHRALLTGAKTESVFTRARARVPVTCCCGGEPQSPAKLVSSALAEVAVRPSATRWTGRPPAKPVTTQPAKTGRK